MWLHRADGQICTRHLRVVTFLGVLSDLHVGDFFLGHLEEAGTNDVLGVKYIYIYNIIHPLFKRLCVLF